jgi:L-threonylcarbamoyladenylate synthase
MKTLRLSADPAHLESDAARAAIAQAAEILRRGGTVAFPTETVYGLGANALDADAVAKIFAAKERPGWDPLIVHIGDSGLIESVAASVSGNARALIDAFWPGPLTLLLPKHPRLPELVTAGRERVGVRMPAHPVALALLRAAAVPVAAPSANRFGHTSATTAEHVADDLDGRIDAILDGGPATHGVESTVLDVRDRTGTILRPGVVTLEQIRAVFEGEVSQLGESAADPAAGQSAVAPGMGMRHYAPRARLVLIEGEGATQARLLAEAALATEAAGEAVGLMLPAEFPAPALENAKIFRWGKWDDPEDLARRLFAGLRWLDAAGVSVIVCPLPAGQGLGVAIRDRLRKAARR